MKILSMADLPARTESAETPRMEIVHLPVAPQITAMTRFSSMMPGRISFMMPTEAVDYLDRVHTCTNGKIDMVAISGPGDPLAVPDTMLQTIRMVKARYPEMDMGLKILGIGSEKFARELAEAGVGSIEMTVNAVEEALLEKIYAWIRPGQKTLKINEAAKLLIREQKNGVSALKYHGINVTIATTLYPGINSTQVGRISRMMMELGADAMAVLPYEPEPGSEVMHDLPAPDEIDKAKQSAAGYLPLVQSKLTGKCSCKPTRASSEKDLSRPSPTPEKPNVAVISSNGVDIDMHLGRADKVLIYGPREDGLPCLLGTRTTPASGGGSTRWKDLAAMINDCFVLLTAQAGETPRQILSQCNIPVLISDEQIEGVVDTLFGGGRKHNKNKLVV